MYEAYWQLRHKPFDRLQDAQAYYPGETHQGALLKLRYAIESRRAAALLTGEPGLGKTLVAQLLQMRSTPRTNPWIWVRYPQLSAAELLVTVADAFDPKAAGSADLRLDTSVRRITDALVANVSRGRHAVLVVDEAQALPGGETLESLRLLTNLTANDESLLTVLLVGQPTLLPRLERVPAFEQRLSVKCLLRPLTLEETVSYVHCRLSAAGAQREIFDSSALDALYRLCQGNARRINRLADLALLVGYAEELPQITATQIETVSDDLVTLAAE